MSAYSGSCLLSNCPVPNSLFSFHARLCFLTLFSLFYFLPKELYFPMPPAGVNLKYAFYPFLPRTFPFSFPRSSSLFSHGEVSNYFHFLIRRLKSFFFSSIFSTAVISNKNRLHDLVRFVPRPSLWFFGAEISLWGLTGYSALFSICALPLVRGFAQLFSSARSLVPAFILERPTLVPCPSFCSTTRPSNIKPTSGVTSLCIS